MTSRAVTKHSESRRSLREVKAVVRYLAEAAPSPVNAKKMAVEQLVVVPATIVGDDADADAGGGGAGQVKIKKGGKLPYLKKVPYVGTQVTVKNLASSGQIHASLCKWYPGVITDTDKDMNFATVKYDDGEVEKNVLAKFIRFA